MLKVFWIHCLDGMKGTGETTPTAVVIYFTKGGNEYKLLEFK